MVKLGGLSRASFYRNENPSTTKLDRDMDLRDAIQRIALKWPGYGRPRITEELKRQGWKVGPNRVLRLMRQDNLLCGNGKFVVTTDSHHNHKVYPNLAAEMTLTGINQLWVATSHTSGWRRSLCSWRWSSMRSPAGRSAGRWIAPWKMT
jgi:hypothetical protein